MAYAGVSFLNKAAGPRPAALFKGRLWHGWALRDFWGRIFYRVHPENWFCLLLKRIENGFSNSHFLFITSFLYILTICKFPWTHDVRFNGWFFTLCLLFWQLMKQVRSWLRSHNGWNLIKNFIISVFYKSMKKNLLNIFVGFQLFVFVVVFFVFVIYSSRYFIYKMKKWFIIEHRSSISSRICHD